VEKTTFPAARPVDPVPADQTENLQPDPRYPCSWLPIQEEIGIGTVWHSKPPSIPEVQTECEELLPALRMRLMLAEPADPEPRVFGSRLPQGVQHQTSDQKSTPIARSIVGWTEEQRKAFLREHPLVMEAAATVEIEPKLRRFCPRLAILIAASLSLGLGITAALFVL